MKMLKGGRQTDDGRMDDGYFKILYEPSAQVS